MTVQEKLDNLTNEGMIDLMYHDFKRFLSVRTALLGKVMYFSTWQRWIRK